MGKKGRRSKGASFVLLLSRPVLFWSCVALSRLFFSVVVLFLSNDILLCRLPGLVLSSRILSSRTCPCSCPHVLVLVLVFFSVHVHVLVFSGLLWPCHCVVCCVVLCTVRSCLVLGCLDGLFLSCVVLSCVMCHMCILALFLSCL